MSSLLDSLAASGHGWVALLSAALALVVLFVAVRWFVRQVRAVVPTMQKWGRRLDDLWGSPEREGHPRQPGVVERMANVESLMDEARRHLAELVEQGRQAADAASRAAAVAEASAKMSAQATDAVMAIAKKVEHIEHEVLSDGGDSLRDQVDALRVELRQHMEDMARAPRRLDDPPTVLYSEKRRG